MTQLQSLQAHERSPSARPTRTRGVGSNLFWLLLAPFCSLLDSRFRSYANNREAADEGHWPNACLRLPDANSCTSWAARKTPSAAFRATPAIVTKRATP